MDRILNALSRLRVNVIIEEYDLQLLIAEELTRERVGFKREYKLGPRNRIDFLTENGIGIEVKKGKPYSAQVIKQLKRYTESPSINGIILVVERNLDLPKTINGKPCTSYGLNKLWGIAL
jgi:hypothetical protein